MISWDFLCSHVLLIIVTPFRPPRDDAFTRRKASRIRSFSMWRNCTLILSTDIDDDGVFRTHG